MGEEGWVEGLICGMILDHQPADGIFSVIVQGVCDLDCVVKAWDVVVIYLEFATPFFLEVLSNLGPS